MAGTNPDMAVITELLSKLGPNATAADVAKLVPKDPSKLGPLLEQIGRLEKPAPNLDTFDYSSLVPGKEWESFWILQLGHLGNNGPDHLPGTKPVFMLYCYDDQGAHRIMEEVKGLPNTKLVLKVLKRAIAAPMVPLKPALPWQLCVSLKLKPQFSEPAIISFLDTLPKPFHWRFETEEEQDDLADGIEEKNKEGSKKSYNVATKMKAEGNAAFAKKEAATAIQAYSDAIDAAVDAFAQKTDESEGPTKELLAMCHANRAASYLLPGEAYDARKALEDGEEAEKFNPAYAKAYIRQAAANEALKDVRQAKCCVERGLKLPALRNNPALKERLTELEKAGA